MSEWQPIETAPHITNPGEGDDEDILIWTDNGAYVACYDENRGGKPMFYTGQIDRVSATHWMPIPEPPKI